MNASRNGHALTGIPGRPPPAASPTLPPVQPSLSGTDGDRADVEVEYYEISVVVLGAAGVGKSSLAEQIVYYSFPTAPAATAHPQHHHHSVVFGNHVYKVTLVDCPAVAAIPASSLDEWGELRGCCLRTADAYVLVYDVTSEASFSHVTSLRDQIVEIRGEVPMIVSACSLSRWCLRASARGNNSGVVSQVNS